MGLRFRIGVIAWLATALLAASEHRGQVTFNGLPVPGATVTAIREGGKVLAITDAQGSYTLAGLSDGAWTIAVEMFGFAGARKEIVVAPDAPSALWELQLLPLAEMQAELQRAVAPAPPATPEAKTLKKAEPAAEGELNQRAADGFLINGSVNNGAASPFAQAAAFGNARSTGKGLYNGGIGITTDTSALNARPYSLTGQDTPKAAYTRLTGLLTFGGPLRIPHLVKNGPNFFVAYQWTRNSNAIAQSALVPDAGQRNGSFSRPVIDPLTGAPFPGNAIPQERISPQARSLLTLYPLPNFTGSTRYSYQVPILSPMHQDALQSRFNKTLGPRNQVYGSFSLQSTRADNQNLFGFEDKSAVRGSNAGINWTHRFGQRWFGNLGYQFSRLSSHVRPYFADRVNVSGQAGIAGNNQDPANWGPPALQFSSGIANLSDAQSSSDRNQTGALAASMLWNRGSHNVTFGWDFRRREFNSLSQQNPRGSFAFTGAQAGLDFAGFLLGIPDTSAIAFGNADKYLRQSLADAYFTDDWRINSKFTLNAGVRWEYGAPVTEVYGRLVNLDIAPGFTAVAPVVAANAAGPLVRPDRRGIEPRVGIAWRPLAASSLVVRAGYGVYHDTSVYQTLALQMAQQPPLSKTWSVQNSLADPVTLANAFRVAPATVPNTFAIDPNFRVGYAQTWQLSVQRDLPGALQMSATYLGIKGTRGMQEFLPNTFPLGAANPCAACPTGFAYLTSNGNSTRESAQVQLRRRLRSGLAASLQYTLAKSLDDNAALGGQGNSANNQNAAAPRSAGTLAIAQNWLNLRAERGLSTFDQRHVLAFQAQYTTGMGLGGGTLLSGPKGTLLKDWTFATQTTAGSGLPQTPVYLAPVQGTGVTGTIRPDATGLPLYAAPAGLSLNPLAYAAPRPGQWGNAGRSSITGPVQFSLSASLARTFRVSDRLNLDLRIDSTNALNHVNYTAWNAVVNGAQFGVPQAANAMRALQTTLRVRF